MQPIRIQRSRQHKQVSPNGLPIVYVGRPGEFGNPFQIGDYVKIGKGGNVFSYLKTTSKYASKEYELLDTVEKVVAAFEKYITNYPFRNIAKLKGKNLSCWCKIGEPCHADILLKIANNG
jgi:hypothetical protein